LLGVLPTIWVHTFGFPLDFKAMALKDSTYERVPVENKGELIFRSK